MSSEQYLKRRAKQLKEAAQATGQTKLLFGTMNSGQGNIPFLSSTGSVVVHQPPVHNNTVNHYGAINISGGHIAGNITGGNGNSSSTINNYSSSSSSRGKRSSKNSKHKINKHEKKIKKNEVTQPPVMFLDSDDPEESSELFQSLKKLKTVADKEAAKTGPQTKDDIKQLAIEAVAALEKKEGQTNHSACDLVSKTSRNMISLSTLQRWTKAAAEDDVFISSTKVDLRCADREFDEAVMNKLWINVIIKTSKEFAGDETPTGAISKVFNIMYSYEMIRLAMIEVSRTDPRFKDQTDKWYTTSDFSKKAIFNFLRRNHYRRVSVTTEDKEARRPTEDEIHSIMKKIQEYIIKNRIPIERIINADETGVWFGASFKFQYIKKGTKERGKDNADSRSRVTEMAALGADGNTLPMYTIVKCSSQKADLTNTTVLNTLLTELTAESGSDVWEKRTWQREITIQPRTPKNGDAPPTKQVLFKRPYLYNKGTHHVVTCQHRAWMDRVGILMWADTLIRPFVERTHNGRLLKWLLIWDNCSTHIGAEVERVLEEYGMHVCKLPPNMTDLLQVLDLIWNGPLKSFLRKERILPMYRSFQGFMANLHGGGPTKYVAPMPTLCKTILSIEKFRTQSNANISYRESVTKMFISAGQIPENYAGIRDETVDLTFKKYNSAVQLKHQGHCEYLAEDKELDREQTSITPPEISELVNIERRSNPILDDEDCTVDDDNDYEVDAEVVLFNADPPAVPPPPAAAAASAPAPAPPAAEGVQFDADPVHILTEAEIESMDLFLVKGHLMRRRVPPGKGLKACRLKLLEHENNRRPAVAAVGGNDLLEEEEEEKNDEEEDDELPAEFKYCLCKKTYQEDHSAMIKCSSVPCKYGKWYHKTCVGLAKKRLAANFVYTCVMCLYNAPTAGVEPVDA